MVQPICVSCKKPFIKNHRLTRQTHCSAPSCQKARKAEWQRKKLKLDPQYKKEQLQATRDWHDKRPDYWRKYRKKNPQKKLRNQLLQRKRNHIRRIKATYSGSINSASSPKIMIAKMDALKAGNNAAFTECWVVPMIAKMDVLKGYLSVNYDYLKPDMSHFPDCKDGRYGYPR